MKFPRQCTKCGETIGTFSRMMQHAKFHKANDRFAEGLSRITKEEFIAQLLRQGYLPEQASAQANKHDGKFRL